MSAIAVRPVRIQRRRTRGFDLQAESRAVNGLRCTYIGRGTQWGNPWRVGWDGRECWHIRQPDWADACPPLIFDDKAAAHAAAVAAYRGWMLSGRAPQLENIAALRGLNLACFCPLDVPCHVDVTLPLANPEFHYA